MAEHIDTRLSHARDGDGDTYDRPTRSEAAVALKVTGASYPQIAKALDYANPTQARQAVEKALAATVTTEEREAQRHIAGRRIESLLLACWGKATDPKNEEHLSAARTALALVDRHIRLYGLDAPAEMVVYTPAGEEMAAWVAAMVETMHDHLPAEPETIEGQIAQ